MRLSRATCLAAATTLFSFCPSASALRIIESKSLNSCQDGSNFTASLFNVAFTPGNNSVSLDVVGVSSISGNVTAQIQVIAYGYTALNQTLYPCELGLDGLCPMSEGQINLLSNIAVSSDVASRIPGIAYEVPDLDGVVRVYIRDFSTGVSLACVEAQLSNGKTVDQTAVGWATAVIAGMGLVASGITSGLGHTNTAAHVAANALSLFGFFQSQALIGMTSVTMPPIVQSWTQDFQWSMGIIRIGFLQSICTWYQRATGGTPTTYLSTLDSESVQVEKRSLNVARHLAQRGVHLLSKRATSDTTADKTVIVRGIDRVGFRAGIEQTNIFLTGLIFFVIFCFLVAIVVAMFKGFCELAVKAGWMKSDKFAEFRAGWKIVLKGILFRLVLLGWVQMSVLCLWEIVERDSAAEVVLALIVFLAIGAALGWASYKVITLAKRSVDMHKNPGYILYSDPKCLNKWGFLYVQYRSSAYYFVVPVLCYLLVKSIFIAFAQSSPVAQAICLVIVEGVALVSVCVYKPFMDKKTNIFNISIASVNLLNVILLLFFSNVFGLPGLVNGIMGVLFVLINVIFAVVLLFLVLFASIYAIFSKNPDVRYQPMRDDRGSFIKSQTGLMNTELDALGATARGDVKTPLGRALDDDDDTSSSDSLSRQKMEASGAVQPRDATFPHAINPTSPVSETPMYPGEQTGRRGPPPIAFEQRDRAASPYGQGRSVSHSPYGYGRSGSRPNAPYSGSPHPPRSAGGNPSSGVERNTGNQRMVTSHSAHSMSDAYQRHQQPQMRQQNNSSPWQRGAGYD